MLWKLCTLIVYFYLAGLVSQVVLRCKSQWSLPFHLKMSILKSSCSVSVQCWSVLSHWRWDMINLRNAYICLVNKLARSVNFVLSTSAQYSVNDERPCPMETVTFTCTVPGDRILWEPSDVGRITLRNSSDLNVPLMPVPAWLHCDSDCIHRHYNDIYSVQSCRGGGYCILWSYFTNTDHHRIYNYPFSWWVITACFITVNIYTVSTELAGASQSSSSLGMRLNFWIRLGVEDRTKQ